MAKRRANGEGSIYKRKDGLWVSQYTDRTGHARYMYGKTQQAVKDKLKEVIKLDDEGFNFEAGKITFASWIMEWLETYVKPKVKQSSYERYSFEIQRHIIPVFSKVLLKDITQPMLQRFLNEKSEKRLDGKKGGYSYSTCKHLRIRLYSSLEKATELGMIIRNPAKHLVLPKPSSKEKFVLTLPQQKKLETVLYSEMGNNYNMGGFLLMLYTGIRLGELMGLQLSDIDFDKKELHINKSMTRIDKPKEEPGRKTKKTMTSPKTETSKRVIPLPDTSIKLLTDILHRRSEFIDIFGRFWKDSNWHEDGWEDYIFLSKFGNVLDSSNMRKFFHIILEKNGFPDFAPHSLRHTFATRWVEAGLDIKSLSEILGHKDASITLSIYTHSLAEQKQKNMDKLSQCWGVDTEFF